MGARELGRLGRRCPLPPRHGTAGPFIVARAGRTGQGPGGPVTPLGALALGSARPGRENGAAGPAARGSREPPPDSGKLPSRPPGSPDPGRPWCSHGVPCSPASRARPVGGRSPLPPSASRPQPAGGRAGPASPPFNPALLPPGRPPPPSARPPHPSCPDSSPATSSGRFPKLNPFLRQLCAAPPRRQLSSPNFRACGLARRPAGREGSPRRAARRPQVPSDRLGAWGPHRGARSATASARGSHGTRPPGARPRPRGSVVAATAGGGRRRRGRGRQGDVSLAARPAPAPAPAPRRPGPRAAAAAAGPSQVSYLQPETREGERKGRSRRRRGTGREEPAEPPPRSRSQAAAGAATPTPSAPSAVGSGRSLAACARVESWHFLPWSWRTAPSAGIAASCLPHPGQPFIEPPFPIGSRPATPRVTGQSQRGRPSRGGGHWAKRRVSASANGRGEELRGAAGRGLGGAGSCGAALGPALGRGGAETPRHRGRGRRSAPPTPGPRRLLQSLPWGGRCPGILQKVRIQAMPGLSPCISTG